MASTNVNIRMDADLKKQFETFCADVGLTMTAAFNVFAKKLCESIEFRLKSAMTSQMKRREKLSERHSR